MARSKNPFAFTPLPVSFLASAIYIAIFATLLVIHHTVPSPPKSDAPGDWPGVNLTQSWLDLKTLSSHYHPYNSRANLNARAWLQSRIGHVLDGNNVTWETDISSPAQNLSSTFRSPSSVVVFDDRSTNITYPDPRSVLAYFESDNLIVYVRGEEDPAGAFWSNTSTPAASLVLVNAHYDSVSTGFGATDDGAGVVSILQLLSHFTSPSVKRPRHGLVLLLNNAEEDGLYGAVAFTKHPIARHTKVFLNLEGAGAGGRATLFRSTDAEITAAYGASRYPFGSVISADGFKRGVIRSGTDYQIFHDVLGMRGLDVAFMGPRSAYHTNRDDVRDSSRGSVWHMMSAALSTTTKLVESDWSRGPKSDSVNGVWFDFLGQVFAVLRLQTLFALNVALLVVGPIVLIILELLLKRQDKWYPFSFKTYLNGKDDDEPVALQGLRGFFRFPLSLVASTAGVLALAYLLTKVNPYIIYSSQYAVWTMMLTAFVSVSWFLLRLGDAVRPSALARLYSLLWLYVLSWILLVVATVAADRFDIAGTYFVSIYNATFLVALSISYLDLFALPSKSQYASHVVLGPAAGSRRESHNSRPVTADANDNTDATERTSLLYSTQGQDHQTFARYNQRRGSQDHSVLEVDDAGIPDLKDSDAYEHEQAWSALLPRWTWLLQILVLLPINLIMIGQIGLLLTTAMHQTPADGNAVLTIYLAIAGLAVLLLVPTTPFLHRIVWQIPTFVFLLCVGSVVYNLLADPFSRESRLKVYFVQRVDTEIGRNEVAVSGVKGWVEKVVAELPSTADSDVQCGEGAAAPLWAARKGLTTCVWQGLSPNVLQDYGGVNSTHTLGSGNGGLSFQRKERVIRTNDAATIAPYKIHQTSPTMKDWLRFSSSRLKTNFTDSSMAQYALTLTGLNTRSCRLYFHPTSSQSILSITVLNACPATSVNNSSFDGEHVCHSGFPRSVPGYATPSVPGQPDATLATNSPQVRLYSRTFDPVFTVVVDVAGLGLEEAETIKGEAVCVWSDANVQGTVPALDELWKEAPVWSTVSKHGDGLVEGVRRFEL